MSHDLTLRADGKTEMAFVGATPWHGLGQRVTEGASIEVWAHEAGLDWQAARAVAKYIYTTPEGDQILREATDTHVIHRSDNGNRVGVVSDKYKIVQPAEVLEFFRDLTEANEWHIHTAGSLNGGARIWAMARNHTEGEVVPGDRVRGNLLLATSLDGTMRTIACMTAIRVVCANTLRIALNDMGKDAVQISHRSEFDADKVKRELGLVRPAFDVFMAQAKAMAEKHIGEEEAKHILRQLFGQPKRAVVDEPIKTSGGSVDGSEFAQLMARAARVDTQGEIIREARNTERVLSLFKGEARGAKHEGSNGTRWGLFNAVTEFVDHESSRTQDTRLTNAWFGKGHDLKTEALKLLTDGTYAA